MGKVLGVIAGIVVMFIIIMAGQFLVIALHPVPVGMDPRNTASIAAWVAEMPLSAQLATLAVWLAATFAGGWLTMLASHWSPGTWIVTLLAVATALNQTLRASYPAWLVVAAVLAPLVGGWLAIRLGYQAAAATDDPDAA